MGVSIDTRTRAASRRWWARTKAQPTELARWLRAQFRGEVTAATRIDALRERHAPADGRAARILRTIADQERRHAAWVADLLRARGIAPVVEDVEPRYWAETLPGIDDLATGCAVGAHAEKMRLARIEAIVADDDAPADVREVFARILPEERFHERAFRRLAGEDALARTAEAHRRGANALGLVP